MENNYLLQCRGGEVLKAPLEIEKMCKLLQVNKFEGMVVPLALHSSDKVNILIEYCVSHQYVTPQPIRVPIVTQVLQMENPFDQKLVEVLDFDNTVDLLLLASFMQCDGLEDLCYGNLAVMMRNSPMEELMKLFGLRNGEFSRDDIISIKQKNPNLMTISEIRIRDFGFEVNI